MNNQVANPQVSMVSDKASDASGENADVTSPKKLNWLRKAFPCICASRDNDTRTSNAENSAPETHRQRPNCLRSRVQPRANEARPVKLTKTEPDTAVPSLFGKVCFWLGMRCKDKKVPARSHFHHSDVAEPLPAHQQLAAYAIGYSQSHSCRSLVQTNLREEVMVWTMCRLRCVVVEGDGNCLYRAVSKNMAHYDGKPLDEWDEYWHAMELRYMAFRTICVDRAEYFERQSIVEGGLEQYRGVGNRNGVHAGEPEIVALSEAMQMPIILYVALDSGMVLCIGPYGKEFLHDRLWKKGGDIVRLLYNGVDHYDALILI